MPYPPFYSTYPPGFGVYGVEGEAPAQVIPEAPTGSTGVPGPPLGCAPIQCPIIFGVRGVRKPWPDCGCETPVGAWGRRRRRPRYVKATRRSALQRRAARRAAARQASQQVGRRKGRYVRASRYGQAATSSEPALMSLGVAVGLGWLVGRL